MTANFRDNPGFLSDADDLRRHGWIFWVAGVLSIVIGALAILMPYVATFATNIAIGAVLITSGVIEGVTAFRARGTARLAGRAVLALLGILAGLALLVFPVGGVVALTFLLAAFFVAAGVTRLYAAWRVRPNRGWGWLVFGGALSLALGLLLFLGLPGTAFWVLGLLLGIDLIFYGVTLIALRLGAERMHSGG